MYVLKNEEICHCKKVTDMDIEYALSNCDTMGEVERTFEEVQKMTKCSTGCGQCHDKIMDIISQMMQG